MGVGRFGTGPALGAVARFDPRRRFSRSACGAVCVLHHILVHVLEYTSVHVYQESSSVVSSQHSWSSDCGPVSSFCGPTAAPLIMAPPATGLDESGAGSCVWECCCLDGGADDGGYARNLDKGGAEVEGQVVEDGEEVARPIPARNTAALARANRHRRVR